MRPLLVVGLLLFAGCVGSPAAHDPAAKVLGATVVAMNSGRTPVTATISWTDEAGKVLRSEDVSLLPDQKAERDFVPPGEGPYVVGVAFRDEVNLLQGWAGNMTWELTRCARWTANFDYDDSVSPVGFGAYDSCAAKP